MFSERKAAAEVRRRNRLRREARLPTLLISGELRRMKSTYDEAGFEAFFEKERSRYAHLWSDRRRGWLTNMGIYQEVRRCLRRRALNRS